MNYLIYDGECRFCCRWIKYWQNLFDLSSLEIVPFQELDKKHFKYDIGSEQFKKELYFIYKGEIYKGAEAVFKLYHLNNRKSLYTLYKYLPGFSLISNLSYKTVAKNRRFFSKFISPK